MDEAKNDGNGNSKGNPSRSSQPSAILEGNLEDELGELQFGGSI